MKNLDVMVLETVAGGAFGQAGGAPTFRPELAGLRQTFDDGSTLTVSPDGWMNSSQGLGPREALLQFRQDGPMSVNSAQSLADNRGVEFLVNNPNIDTVHIQASGQTFDSRGNVVESMQSGATTRAGMGQIFNDGSRLLDPTSPDSPLPTQSFDGLQQQIQNERANASANSLINAPGNQSAEWWQNGSPSSAGVNNAFNQENLPGWSAQQSTPDWSNVPMPAENFPPQSAWQAPQTETPNWSNVPFPESNTNGSGASPSFANESNNAATPSFKEDAPTPQPQEPSAPQEQSAPQEDFSGGSFDQSGFESSEF